MGIILSRNKKESPKPKVKLQTVIYCSKCRKTYLFNEYYKHIVSCNRENSESLRRERHTTPTTSH